MYFRLCLQACVLNDKEIWVYGMLGKFSFTLCSKVLKWSQGGYGHRGMRTKWEITVLVLKKESLETNKECYFGHVRKHKELRNA